MGKLMGFDFAIIYLLRDKETYDVVQNFISALLVSQGYKRVKILALLDIENNNEEFSPKRRLASLIVEDTEHNKYIIEIERRLMKGFVNKVYFNKSLRVVEQLETNIDYTNIRKVFNISLLYLSLGNGVIYEGKAIMHQKDIEEKLTFHIEDKETQMVYHAVDVLPEYIYISIPHFDDKIQKEVDEWIYLMKNGGVRAKFKSPTIKKTPKILDMLKMSKELLNEYFNYTKQVIGYKDALETAEERGVKRGMVMGTQHGIKEGIQQGIQEGIQQGIDKQKLVMAKIMADKGFGTDVIQDLTGLHYLIIKNLIHPEPEERRSLFK